MPNNIHKVIIIGSGPSGLTAAIYTARAKLKPLVISGMRFGGQLMNTSEVENFPGFPKGILGPELMQNMLKQAQKFGTEFIFQDVTTVDFSKKIKKVYIGQNVYKGESVIITTGADPKRLGLDGEARYNGKGVSYCATCDGPFYKDKEIAVVGGGDSAAEEANFLTRFAKKVFLIVRRDQLRASKIMQDKVRNNKKITIFWNSEIKEILGDEKVVSGIKIINNKTNKYKKITLHGIFVAIGHRPNTAYLGDEVEFNKEGYIKVYDNTRTSVEGVFVAGDVHDFRYQQAITAAGFGAMAALDVEKYLETIKG